MGRQPRNRQPLKGVERQCRWGFQIVQHTFSTHRHSVSFTYDMRIHAESFIRAVSRFANGAHPIPSKPALSPWAEAAPHTPFLTPRLCIVRVRPCPPTGRGCITAAGKNGRRARAHEPPSPARPIIFTRWGVGAGGAGEETWVSSFTAVNGLNSFCCAQLLNGLYPPAKPLHVALHP